MKIAFAAAFSIATIGFATVGTAADCLQSCDRDGCMICQPGETGADCDTFVSWTDASSDGGFCPMNDEQLAEMSPAAGAGGNANPHEIFEPYTVTE